jgi:hypothetical protein
MRYLIYVFRLGKVTKQRLTDYFIQKDISILVNFPYVEKLTPLKTVKKFCNHSNKMNFDIILNGQLYLSNHILTFVIGYVYSRARSISAFPYKQTGCGSHRTHTLWIWLSLTRDVGYMNWTHITIVMGWDESYSWGSFEDKRYIFFASLRLYFCFFWATSVHRLEK